MFFILKKRNLRDGFETSLHATAEQENGIYYRRRIRYRTLRPTRQENSTPHLDADGERPLGEWHDAQYCLYSRRAGKKRGKNRNKEYYKKQVQSGAGGRWALASDSIGSSGSVWPRDTWAIGVNLE